MQNEGRLRAAIIDQWGVTGFHCTVYDMLLSQRQDMLALLAEVGYAIEVTLPKVDGLNLQTALLGNVLTRIDATLAAAEVE